MTAKPLYVLFFSDRGEERASLLSRKLGALLLRPKGHLTETLSRHWSGAGAFIAVGAAAILIRGAAPLLSDKAADPALIVVPEDGAFVLPLLGSHLAGGLDLARRCAQILDAPCLPTTATDRRNVTAPDLFASRLGWPLLGKRALTELNGRLADGGKLSCFVDPDLDGLPPLPWGYSLVETADKAQLLISWKKISLSAAQCQIVPPLITAGMGCRPGTTGEALLEALEKGLETLGLRREALCRVATIDRRASDSSFAAGTASWGLSLVTLTGEEIGAVEGVFSPSAARRHLGLPGVAEPCAARFGRLLAPRSTFGGITVAFAAARPVFRGKLAVVGTGPGNGRFLTAEARDVLEGAQVLVGYGPYLDRLPQALKERKELRRFTMGEEEERVRLALDLSRKGYDTALVSGGDPVLFGMAGLVLNLAGDKEIRIVPGISAVQAAAALLGAPYTNGLSCISLSDYLQPWPDVIRALEGAAAGGLAVALYNPVRRGLEEKLAEVARIFADRVFLVAVRNVGRDDESLRSIPLEELHADVIDMTTLLFLPPRGAQWRGNRLIDSRGYGAEGEKK
ncbi:cobalamin biosynthesis protein [Aminirod propionatiphilus]|uniref:Bifunctional cobalt-precorrin 5A hydrolase/precorrin-3B C(17)-methyltransferase n=1 Tax=Aminirod propionatiphilus TaxID=3415223 RepID=A0ACD1DYH6_9BACT|nr:bifunctional cobalt-precorrin 5A hydrolase/precorrin-3B C(17)-methyltransferase [Synergistota bacterium]